MRIIFTLVCLCFWSATPLAAQLPSQPCMEDENFRAFDFWLGTWEVRATGSDTLAGHNRISRIENGCALKEEWVSANGGTGQSLNYYNPLTEKWRQLWISAAAYLIDIEGAMKDGAMRLDGTIFYYQTAQNGDAQTFDFRGTWTPAADGSVRQFFEQRNPETGEWAVWFDGTYRATCTKASNNAAVSCPTTTHATP